jgi:hypothetical protein
LSRQATGKEKAVYEHRELLAPSGIDALQIYAVYSEGKVTFEWKGGVLALTNEMTANLLEMLFEHKREIYFPNSATERLEKPWLPIQPGEEW